MPTRLRVISTLLWFVASLMLLVGPGFAWWGNHATPRVLGLPWSHAWVWGIVVANFVVLVVVHTTRWLDGELDGELDEGGARRREEGEPADLDGRSRDRSGATRG